MPLFLQVRYVNVYVLAILSVTRTLGDTRGQTGVPWINGSAQFADPDYIIMLANTLHKYELNT